ncbi:MAG: bifunctional DNA-formamidopyrimidine glycosylase/DNA-(apurinic or apyrimidinic site) lyase [Thiotrichaceae bacterium]|nr:bifunctional DNA-formamidopyrimidine glycosylase/DNA-(apurinic or apyrimidinic site) lyase [Thiotrichaceae bacterium]
MPELPEVETTLRGIHPHLLQQKITAVRVYQPKLRWAVPDELQTIIGQRVLSVKRRAKYLLIETKLGSVIIHLGMSGSLRLCDKGTTRQKHDHVEFEINQQQVLRLHDPRRFGCVLFSQDPLQHKLLINLGPEPLLDAFTAKHLYQRAGQRKVSIKSFIMDAKNVVGVGNIYANEALFMAGISPKIAVGCITLKRYQLLVDAIKQVLADAIKQGGTTLNDFVNADGDTGYFQLKLNVYGQNDKPCSQCETMIIKLVQNQRASFYCPQCQS